MTAWIKAKWEAAMFWPRWFYDVFVDIGCRFFVDALIPDLPHSLGMARTRGFVWQMTRFYGVPWRTNDSLWSGIRACFSAHAALKRTARDCARLEAKLRPLMEPGESPQQFLERLPQMIRMAEIGHQAKREQEECKSGGKNG
jgi:hypothetical protein